MKRIRKALAEGAYLLDLKAPDLESIFHQVLNHLVARDRLDSEQRDEVEKVLLEREAQASTAIGHAVAVPHAYLESFEHPAIVFVRLARPLNLGAPDGIPTRYVFVLLGPPGYAVEHLDTLMHVARLMSDEEFRYDCLTARTGDELLSAFDRFLVRNAPPPEEREVKPSDGLRYTGKPFGGIARDIGRRLPNYLSDFRDGLHPKCLSSVLFLFFACIAPAVTFGGVMATMTGNHIGAVEMIIATAVCGVAFALCAGQPLIILGGTGPLLIFTAILYETAESLQLPFQPTYACVGLWTGLIVIVLAAADASCLMRYFTRFTDEIFAALISIIFIVTACEALVKIFMKDEVNHAAAFLSLLLTLGTFYFAMTFSRFRRSRYLLPQMREFLADFGPSISLALMTLVALWLHAEVKLDRLNVPDDLKPTHVVNAATGEARAWLIDFTGLPPWVWFAAAGPAALLAVLVYMDQNITARLVNSPDHKIAKGEAYHLDMAVVGGLITISSIFGLPWLVAATVRSLNHVRSLATMEEVVTPHGDKRERVIHVRENRVTALSIHLLIGVSLLLLPLLKAIPMPVLYGLFLYMGVVSMAGNQFFERLSLWLMDSNLYPATHYIRKVPNWVIHRFTFIQFMCLAGLMLIEVTPLRIIFPLFIALLVPVRLWMGRWFEPQHLAALDAEEEPDEEETHWI